LAEIAKEDRNMAKVQITTSIEFSTYAALDVEAKAEGLKMTEYARRIIERRAVPGTLDKAPATPHIDPSIAEQANAREIVRDAEETLRRKDIEPWERKLIMESMRAAKAKLGKPTKSKPTKGK
jgi:hypothetical protein